MAANPRTAARAAIKRATQAAHERMFDLDVRRIDLLEAAYAAAAADMRATIEASGDESGSVRIETLQSLLEQINNRIRSLGLERDRLLEGGLTEAATIGASPWAGVPEVAAILPAVAHEAAQFVATFTAEDGLRLSDRLWRLDNGAREVVAERIQQAVIKGWHSSKATAEFLRAGRQPPPEMAALSREANASTLGRRVADGLMTGEGSAYANARRVFRTEINRAHGMAFQAVAFEHPDVIGTRFLLSPAHPRPDICDMHASVNRYGLGKGVYPKGKSPWPAHPNTLSFEVAVFSDEVTDEDRDGQEDRIDWLNRQSATVQESVLGKHKRAALTAARLREGEIKTPWRILKQKYEKQGIDLEA